MSALPLMPPLSQKTLNTYYTAYAGLVGGIIAFGALVAPILEVRLGFGGERQSGAVRGRHGIWGAGRGRCRPCCGRMLGWGTTLP